MTNYNFQPLLPAGYAMDLPAPPYRVTGMTPEGTTEEFDVTTGKDLSEMRGKFVAFKVHEPSFRRTVIDGLKKHTGLQTSMATSVVNYLMAEGYLVEPESAEPWIVRKVAELDLSKFVADQVIDWYNNPDKYPTVGADIGNRILTVKEVAGGRVVVSPNGHTLAYSMAKRIYDSIQGREVHTPPPHRVSAGEYTGRGRYRYAEIHHGKYRLEIDKRHEVVAVGCQSVPFSALFDLAKNEGW